ncbi:MAG: hypothetical protein AB1499_01380, partial [Nitrospirota bacterium]
MIKKIVTIMLLLFIVSVSSAYAELPTYVYPSGLTVSAGYQDIVVRFNTPVMETVNVIITPTVNTTTYYEDCAELYYLHRSYWTQPCYRLRVALDQPLSLNTWYEITLKDGSVLLNTYQFYTGGNMVSYDGAQVIFDAPAARKAKVASCKYFYVTLWNDPLTGINFQKWDFNDNPIGSVINVANSSFYSSQMRPSLDMNDRCDMIIGWMNDYVVSRSTSITYKYKSYSSWNNTSKSWGMAGTIGFTGSIPQWIVDETLIYHQPYYEMLFDNGGPAVAVSENGATIFAYQEPMCRWDEQHIYNWFCDNYIKAWFYNPSGGQYGEFLGEYRTSNPWHFHAGQTVNNPPNWDLYPSVGCGGKGSAYDCPYHVEADLTNELAVIKWTEFGGNVNGYENRTQDDLAFRVYDVSSQTMSPEISVAYNSYWTGTAFDQWGGRCVSGEGINKIACTWMDRTSGLPETSNIRGRVFDVNGSSVTAVTGEVNISENRAGDQINPNVAFKSNDELVFAWESNSLDAAGGYGVYSRITDLSLNNLTGDIRLNEDNTIKNDWEDESGISESDLDLCDVWSDHVGLSCNSFSDCYFAWNYPDYQCTNCAPNYSGYASHYHKGYSIKSAMLLNC